MTKTLRNGQNFLIEANTRREKLYTCEFGGDTVRISHRGRTVTTRKIKETNGQRQFTYLGKTYTLKEA